MRVISKQTRSRAANRKPAVERFAELMREAVRKVPARKKTGVSRAAKSRRLEKRQHSIRKRERSKKIRVED